MIRVTTRNARFQQWQALLTNRTKRQRTGEFLVHGVRPITLAIAHGWPIRALLHDEDRPLSEWARQVLGDAPPSTERAVLTDELLHELGEKDDRTPELVAVVEMPPDAFDRLVMDKGIGLVFDRPTSPGNIGALIRSADAFGATSVLVTGHGADPYDPKAVRASAGSLFAVPVVRAPSHREVLDWLGSRPIETRPVLVATDEHGEVDVADADLTGPTFVLIGNEASGLSAAWREACDLTVRIPIAGSASSLNAASAATVVLYEAARQRSRRW